METWLSLARLQTKWSLSQRDPTGNLLICALIFNLLFCFNLMLCVCFHRRRFIALPHTWCLWLDALPDTTHLTQLPVQDSSWRKNSSQSNPEACQFGKNLRMKTVISVHGEKIPLSANETLRDFMLLVPRTTTWQTLTRHSFQKLWWK